MVETPAGYEAYPDARYVDIGMSFGLVDVDAAESVSSASFSRSQAAVSHINQVYDRVELNTAKYATLEPNLFVLDGYCTVYPNSVTNVETGLVSNDLSNASGTYSYTERLTINFSSAQSSYGLTFIFDAHTEYEYPKQITVQFLSGSTVLWSGSATCDSNEYVLEAHVENYNKITVAFDSTWIPYRRVRLTELIFGTVYKYTGDSIVSMSEKSACSVLMESLASTETTITIDNSNKLYNLINPEGAYEYLQEGQSINYYLSVNGVAVGMGVRYFTSADSTDSGLTASLTFNDRLYSMDDMYYNNGQTGTWTLSSAVADVLSAAGLSFVNTSYAGSIGSRTIRRCVPQNTTCREALRMMAQAAMCILFVDRNGVLRFVEPELDTVADHDVIRDCLLTEPTVSVKDKFNAVEIRRRDEYAGTDEESVKISAAASGEVELVKSISNPLINDLTAYANFALGWVQHRTEFNIRYRGNPLLELGDTLKVYDVFDVDGNALAYDMQLEYNGGLNGSIKAIR